MTKSKTRVTEEMVERVLGATRTHWDPGMVQVTRAALEAVADELAVQIRTETLAMESANGVEAQEATEEQLAKELFGDFRPAPAPANEASPALRTLGPQPSQVAELLKPFAELAQTARSHGDTVIPDDIEYLIEKASK